MDLSEEIESILYIAREVSVYKIPPRVANEGYRANDWGDLAEPLWKGRLRIIENSKGASLNLEDAQTGELFARAEYDVERPSVEAVLDSSRYFVIRVEDTGKRAYIGMGFAERSDSFDFNVALQDYTKRRRAHLNPDAEESSPHVPTGPKKDYSLKEGQTFSISLPGHAKAATGAGTNLLGSSTASGSSSGGAAIPLLPPPPSANRKH
ncbi:adaptin ear-binding coat-associated protein 1 NECAP-1 [Crepidotus variabilis]|uniref:Adaptin ear-binding coat-associated protein 1 NECAP-1 n=1 Tax=Crepidotus variabilis TaxID=179855 RepID=A0A9P6JNQ0_9AGAR|nr:adaptin ear-binding coat-associated protein 1 NECAP-1 [Crepidotus variabilis]